MPKKDLAYLSACLKSRHINLDVMIVIVVFKIDRMVVRFFSVAQTFEMFRFMMFSKEEKKLVMGKRSDHLRSRQVDLRE